MRLTLARATDADVPEIVALMNLAYRGTHDGWNTESYITGVRTTDEAVREEIVAKPLGRQLIWRQDAEGPILASVWVEPTDRDNVWYLGSLTIHPDAQNGGLGRALLAAAENWISEHGGRRIKMTVVQIRTGLLAWYERRGYRLTGDTEAFPYGDERFGTPQRDDLYFLVLEKQLIGS